MRTFALTSLVGAPSLGVAANPLLVAATVFLALLAGQSSDERGLEASAPDP